MAKFISVLLAYCSIIISQTEQKIISSTRNSASFIDGSDSQFVERLSNVSLSTANNLRIAVEGFQEGSVLILTPYIERGEINIARELSRVERSPFPQDLLSYSGYFTVNKNYNSNMFFWFFPAEHNTEEAPLLLWLQGGPGQPSHLGIFMEIGPFYVNEDLETLSNNPFSWCKNYSVLFVDNPVGAGFSFTDDSNGYSTNQSQISENLYSVLIQFFTVFPQFQEKSFYITGESYGAKHATSLAYTIHKYNTESSFFINLKGIAVASGFIDPWSFLNYSDFLYHVGVIDGNTRDMMKVDEINGRAAIDNNDYLSACEYWTRVLSLYRRHSRFTQNYNFVQSELPHIDSRAKYCKFVESREVRRALHVGYSKKFRYLRHIGIKLASDIMTSGRTWLEFLLNNGYKVLFFNGQLDVICAYPLAENFYDTLNFTSTEEYRSAQRKPWYVNGKLSGYTKSAGNFTEALVLNAGHMVSMDQPENALDLITKFIYNNT